MTKYALTITTCAPLHIGSGKPALRKGTDFIGYGRTIYVLDSLRVLEHIVPDTDDIELLNKVTHTQNLGSFLKEQDFREHPELAAYRLGGASSVNEVQVQIKDVYNQPYLPGSSLKGALRTAIIDSALIAQQRFIDVRQLDNRDKYAAQERERDAVGRGDRSQQNPNFDLLRTVHVADSQPCDRRYLGLSNVNVWPAGETGIPLDVETVYTGATFQSTLTIDEFLFSAQAQKLGFGPKRVWLTNLAAACRAQSQARIAQEQAFWAGRNDAQQLLRFYQALSKQLAECDEHSFLLQIGWGAGWNSKTLVRTLQASPNAIEQAVQRYRLARGGGRSSRDQRARVFPATRHVVIDQRRPISPLGWVKVDMVER